MLEDALKLDPLNPRAMIAMGEVYLASERYSEAVAMLIRAREASPNDTADLFAMIGACCLKAERSAAAIAYLERAVSLDSRQFSARRALIGLGRKPVVAAVKREPSDAAPAQRKPHVKHIRRSLELQTVSSVTRVTALTDGAEVIEALSDILVEVVANGGSVSFMHPLSREVAANFWKDSLAKAERGERVVLGASQGDDLIGTVTLDWRRRPTSRIAPRSPS